MKKILPLVFAILTICGLSHATPPWKAQWLVAPPAEEKALDDGKTPPNSWFAFRKTIDIKGQVVEATTWISVDSKYFLWVNGSLVVFEGGLKRGPTPDDTYIDAVDLKPYLRQGKNTIAILLWHFGKEGFSHKNSGKAGLFVQGSIVQKRRMNDKDAEVPSLDLLSDKTWKVRRHPAYGDTGKPEPNYRLPESNIRFDAREEMIDWNTSNFDDSAWPNALQAGTAPVAPWNKLVERPIPLWKTSALREYKNKTDLPGMSTGETIICTLPYNAHFTPYLKIDAPAGLTIGIQTDNYKGGGPENLRTEYVTRKGVQEFESLSWINGHDMRYTIPKGVKILSLKYRETGYNTEFTGSFKCEDEFFNTLWQKSLRTLYVTMRDTYMDCPDRERAQWWGDAVNEIGEAFYALDLQSHLLARKGMLELVNWQRANDTIYSPVPAGNWDKELPMQMLNSVGWYGFWNYYLHTGDKTTIEAVYPHVRRYLSLWKILDNGLVENRKGDWTWGDWGEEKDMPILYNEWYYLALKAQKAMAELVGATSDIPGIEKNMNTIRANFNKTFWNGKEYRSPGYKGQTDDRANGIAVVAGLTEPSQYDAIMQVLASQYHASPYTEKYILEALFMMDNPQAALDRMKKRFTPMVKANLTTLYEGWGIGSEGFGGGTYNHAWSGGPLTMLSQFVAGIAPITPAYETYQVLPQPGHLKEISAEVDSVKGMIKVSILRSEKQFNLNLTSPEKTTAIVGIPKAVLEQVSEITINNSIVYAEGKALKSLPEGVRFEEENTRFIQFSVAPGTWIFKAQERD